MEKEYMKKILIAAMLLLTSCAAADPENGAAATVEQTTTVTSETVVTTDETIGGTEILTERQSPEIHVTAEEFTEEMGYQFYIPDGVVEVDYVIDTDSHRGLIGFYLDDVLCNIKVKRSDVFFDIDDPYVTDDWEKLTFEPDEGQILKVHGADPEVRYWKINYSDTNKAYWLSAEWFLEDEGIMTALICYSEKPVHTMPIEVFG